MIELRYIFLAFLMLIYITPNFGQLKIDAGEYGIVCQNEWGITPDTIGGNPTVIQGSGKYRYTWETYLEINSFGLSFKYNASNFLDDTTKANPIVINPSPDSEEGKIIRFYLNVFDSLTTELARDSVDVYFSKVQIIPTQYQYDNVNIGDSIQLTNNFIGMEFPIVAYNWTPGKYLVDSTAANTLSYPESDVTYSLTVTDSLGCSVTVEHVVDINMHLVSIPNYKLEEKPLFTVVPNPINNDSFIYCKQKQDYDIIIFDSSGRIIKKDKINREKYSLSFIDLIGTYYYLILSNDSPVYCDKFLKFN